jgi:hypothetical protein
MEALEPCAWERLIRGRVVCTRGTMACLGQDPDKILKHDGRGISHCGDSLKTPKVEGKSFSDPLVLFLSSRMIASHRLDTLGLEKVAFCSNLEQQQLFVFSQLIDR